MARRVRGILGLLVLVAWLGGVSFAQGPEREGGDLRERVAELERITGCQAVQLDEMRAELDQLRLRVGLPARSIEAEILPAPPAEKQEQTEKRVPPQGARVIYPPGHELVRGTDGNYRLRAVEFNPGPALAGRVDRLERAAVLTQSLLTGDQQTRKLLDSRDWAEHWHELYELLKPLLAGADKERLEKQEAGDQ